MKTLAELKRTIKVGTKLKLVRHDWFAKGGIVVHGNLGTTRLKPKYNVGCVRRVAVVHTTEIGIETFNPQGGSEYSWLQWPKAAHVRFTDNGFEIDLNGDGQFDQVMGYEFTEELCTSTPATE
jgi:hypothetical protein